MAAGLAAGVEPRALLARLTEAGPRGIAREPLAVVSGLFARSLLRPAPFRRAVEALVPARRFGELRVPLTVSVVDLDTGELLLFGAEGERRPAGGRALRQLRAAALLPARAAGRPALRRRRAPGRSPARGGGPGG